LAVPRHARGQPSQNRFVHRLSHGRAVAPTKRISESPRAFTLR
jgi:hypothetical protein